MPPGRADGSSLFFETFNRGKRSVALDLREPRDRETFEALVRSADAVFSNLRGDQPDKLRLRYEDLREHNPRIVCVSLSGFGTTGPRRSEGAYDATIQALAGWMSVTGGPDAPPTRTGLSLVDFAAGYVAALAVLAGVHRARRDGVGCDADLSLFETALSLLTYMGTWTLSGDWRARRMPDSAHQTVVPFQAFEASDGWLLVACANESLWRRLCGALGRPELASDPRFADLGARDANRDELVPLLARAFAAGTVAHWLELLAAAGVPCAPVNDLEAALHDPQAEARGAVQAYEHPVLGEVRTVASPLRLDGAPPGARRAPLLGEHGREILGELDGPT